MMDKKTKMPMMTAKEMKAGGMMKMMDMGGRKAMGNGMKLRKAKKY